MKTTQQITYTFELTNADLQEAIANYLRPKVEIIINPSKLKFSIISYTSDVIDSLVVKHSS